MPIVAKLDELGRPAWIALMILGFIVWWPLGLASPRVPVRERTHGLLAQRPCPLAVQDGKDAAEDGLGAVLDERKRRGRKSMGRQSLEKARRPAATAPSTTTGPKSLRRLEDEQKEFHDFLGRLRQAKDKAEFDQFMSERRNRPNPPNPESPPQN